MITLGNIIVSIALVIGSWLGYQPPAPLGSYNFTGGGTYRLQSSVGTTDTSVSLSSFKEPISNLLYTMSYLNTTIGYGTLEPANTTKKEFVSFTGITQNSDGSATLTGVSRGLSFSYPFTASTTLQQTHSGQSIFILSNTPQFYTQFARLDAAGTSTAIWAFNAASSLPGYTTGMNVGSAYASSSQFASKGYIDGVSIAGASVATGVLQGLVSLGTGLQAASSTATGAGPGGSSYVIPTNIASAVSSANYLSVVTKNNGKINQGFLDLAENFTFSGATTTITSATTTINGTNPIVIIGSTSTPSVMSGLTVVGPTYHAGGVGIGNATSTTNANLVVQNNAIIYGTASTSYLTVQQGCTGCVHGYYSTTTAVSLTTGSGNLTSWNTSCQAGEKIISGGFAIGQGSITAANWYSVQNNYPITSGTNGWETDVMCMSASCPANNITVYAVCGKF